MTQVDSSTTQKLLKDAAHFLASQNYIQASSLYEQIINHDPEKEESYWYLGLCLLLQGQETEAQTTWMFGMSLGDSDEIDSWTKELSEILEHEAKQQVRHDNPKMAWVIRQHIREIIPWDIDNLLILIQLSIVLKRAEGQDIENINIASCLKTQDDIKVNLDLLLETISKLSESASSDTVTVDFLEACVPHITSNYADKFINLIIQFADRVEILKRRSDIGIRLIEVGLQLDENNDRLLTQLSSFCHRSGNYSRSIATAKKCYELSEDLPKKILNSHTLIRALISTGGNWGEAVETFETHLDLVKKIISEKPLNLSRFKAVGLFNSLFFQPYIRDDLKSNRWLQNKIAQISQLNVEEQSKERRDKYHSYQCDVLIDSKEHKPLKIGYISHCFKAHSVGWIARWLFAHHNRDNFKLYLYPLRCKSLLGDDPLQEWFYSQADSVYELENHYDHLDVADQIHKDGINILVDLDSITLDLTCEVMALKPAPVQVTWLGWDASGIPSVDYFIADPYVLPEHAQDHYSEKIWRLPQSYVAVDGFEVGAPTLRRQELDIPDDAIVYFSSQRGFKRHLNTVRLQLRILKKVPNSYFLIKGIADADVLEDAVKAISEEEGVDPSRLRFLPYAPLEKIHRANLRIADVVLDTYPYNGATTTLETLWMALPLVTRVGETFSSRNSYTMMMNVGVTEGIAWSDDEYIDWGVRLGQDKTLRQRVTWKLLQSRRTAPLWNTKQFAQNMENAYEKMWEFYCKEQRTR